MFSVNKIAVKKATNIQLNTYEAEKFFTNNEYLIVGYTGISRNNTSKTQVLASVVFVNLTDLEKQVGSTNPKSAFSVTLDIPLGVVKKLPISIILQKIVKQNKDDAQEHYLKVVKKLDFQNYQYQLQQQSNSETQGRLNDSIPSFTHFTKAIDKALNYLTPQNPQDKQPFKFYKQDGNTWLVTEDPTQKLTFLLHPILLLNSHYGASSEIVRILFREPIWENVLEKLNYNYCNPNSPKSVLISDKLAVSDCVFLHHFKNDDYTLKKVKELHSRTTQKLTQNNKSYLQIEPYHNQPVNLSVKGIDVGGGVIWVTEILAISEPMGEAVYFDIATKDNTKQGEMGDNTTTLQAPKILARIIMDETVLITKEQVNNEDIAVIKSDIGILDEQKRQKIFNEAISKDEWLYPAKTNYIIKNNEALRFAMGERVGTGGEVGFLNIINGEVALEDCSETTLQEQYLHLIEKAKQAFSEVKSYTINKGIIQDFIPMLFLYQQSHPKTAFVLVTAKDSKRYVFVDCEKTGGVGSAGLIFEWQTEWEKQESFKDFIKLVLTNLANNRGATSEELSEWLGENKIKWAKYNHINKGKWVENALKNLDEA